MAGAVFKATPRVVGELYRHNVPAGRQAGEGRIAGNWRYFRRVSIAFKTLHIADNI
jgi:hypothetical protein